jgi:hypothetical protein
MLENSMKQIISIILCLGLSFPATIFAQEADDSSDSVDAKLIEIKKNDPAPFDGVLLNPPAAAQMLANEKYLKEGCQIKIDYELSKLQAQHDLVLKSLQISLETSEKKYDSIMMIKNEEIERLNEIALENSGDYSHWWAAGGFVAGALISLGIFFAASEASK